MPSKNIQYYFSPYPHAKERAKTICGDRATPRASGQQVKDVPGLSVLTSFITLEEESALLAFLDSQQWRTDLSRRTMHFGGTYCLMPPPDASPSQRRAIEQNILTAAPIPKELNFVVQRMVEHGLYTERTTPCFCIVNEYLPAQGISAHIENFRFAEPVCSLTLAGGDSMRFHELECADDGSVRSGKASIALRTGRRADIQLERRSLAVLSGDARSKWQHEIVRGRKTGKPLGVSPIQNASIFHHRSTYSISASDASTINGTRAPGPLLL